MRFIWIGCKWHQVQFSEYLDESEEEQDPFEGEDDKDYIPDDELTASDVEQEVEKEANLRKREDEEDEIFEGIVVTAVPLAGQGW